MVGAGRRRGDPGPAARARSRAPACSTSAPRPAARPCSSPPPGRTSPRSTALRRGWSACARTSPGSASPSRSSVADALALRGPGSRCGAARRPVLGHRHDPAPPGCRLDQGRDRHRPARRAPGAGSSTTRPGWCGRAGVSSTAPARWSRRRARRRSPRSWPATPVRARAGAAGGGRRRHRADRCQRRSAHPAVPPARGPGRPRRAGRLLRQPAAARGVRARTPGAAASPRHPGAAQRSPGSRAADAARSGTTGGLWVARLRRAPPGPGSPAAPRKDDAGRQYTPPARRQGTPRTLTMFLFCAS